MTSDTRYKGEPMTHALLQRRQAEVQDRHRRTVSRVSELLETQKQVGGELGDGLAALARDRGALERLDRDQQDASLLAALVRPFTARRTALARRSVAEGLFQQYERVSVRLREATAFSDELKLCALELQQEVDRLHRDVSDAVHDQQVAAQRVLRAEAALAGLDGAELAPEQRERLLDRHTFELRTETVALELYGAAIALGRQHLPAARLLRDTVLQLHEDMAHYVLTATHTVNTAGRKIQGLGLLADAPSVITELQEGLDSLDLALRATADYVERTRGLIDDVLPELTARLEAHGEADAVVAGVELAAVDRERSRREAERALRAAARAEIDELLGDDG